jgi:hypothetical protein
MDYSWRALVADLRMCRTTEVARKVATTSVIMLPVARAVNGLGLVYKGPSPLLNLERFPRNISCASASEVSPLIPCRPLLLSFDSKPCHLMTSPLNLAPVKAVTVRQFCSPRTH